jgi:hypothetical protein
MPLLGGPIRYKGHHVCYACSLCSGVAMSEGDRMVSNSRVHVARRT